MIQSGAPERQAELDKIWEEHSPVFINSEDKPGFILEAGAYRSLKLTDRTLRLIWTFGHIAWRALSLYAALIHLCSGGKSELNFDEAESDSESKELIAKHVYLLECFRNLRNAETILDYTWPGEIPSPAHTRPSTNDEETVVYDLVGIAMVFMFLHEIKHIQFSIENAAIGSHKEELECDRYARLFLLENIKKHSSSSGENYSKVLGKRAMGIALASFLILELTPNEQWCGSETHPSVYTRLSHLMDYPKLDNNANYWLYLGSLMIMKLRLLGIDVPPIRFENRREFCSIIFRIFNNLESKS